MWDEFHSFSLRETPRTDVHSGDFRALNASAAPLLHDGGVVAAAQELLFAREKGDASYHANAVEYCRKEAGIWSEGFIHHGFLRPSPC